MKISRDNYEIWFLDYLEGNLEESMIDDFLLFLEENQDLAEELRLYEPIGLRESEMMFPDRTKLYKQPFDLPGIFDEMAVGMMEGDLDAKTHHSFLNYLNDHPEKNREMELFRKTRINPDMGLIFNGKQNLYRQPAVFRITPLFILKIAAIFIFIWSSSVIFDQTGNHSLKDPGLTIFTSENQNIISENKQDASVLSFVPVNNAQKSDKKLNAFEEADYSSVHTTASPGIAAEQIAVAYAARVDQPSLLSPGAKLEPALLLVGHPELTGSMASFEWLAQAEPQETYLTDKLIKQINLPDIKMGKIIRWGLTLASGITKGKFNYSTGESGDIIALNLDTRLLGFSIPVNEK